MQITLDIPTADTAFIQTQAARQNMSLEEFSHAAIMKAARNAAYIDRIRQAKKNLDAGKGTFLTNDELRELIYGR